NNRWAKKRYLPGIAGHKAGVKAVREVIETCPDAGVEVLTLFAFSSENWKRHADEVSALMELFMAALRREVNKLDSNGIRLKILGELSRFHPDLQAAIARAEQQTAENTRFTLQIAANYGGRWDIAQAAQHLAQQVKDGQLEPQQISEALINQHLVTHNGPEPDLLIRTGGEQRISNFLLWQMAYTEFYFTDLYWPDFKRQAMQDALDSFTTRERRFGRTSEQLAADKKR
ncbi:MAG: di-trans,poly-cis-decaprenylcistransferase, partial [Thiopseudomonas sp.]|nr:di-trans,poly-cis-decaprenylcistransferase [Thiopseudomonas sp.]